MKQPCRFCNTPLSITFCDLGKTPPSNSYLKELNQKEYFFPLHALVCENCLLVQLEQFQTPSEIFSDYAYFSSYSKSWVAHAKNYVKMATERFKLKKESLVVEIASNDGYLLQYFKAKNIPILGIEPAQNVAEYAKTKGIPTLVQFFGLETATQVSATKQADLLIGNNVLAHVPNLNDFVSGLKTLLKTDGVITLEFPHLLQLILQNQFDTIYHEHFSYFSLFTIEKIFKAHQLKLFDVEEIPTHGGSLRIYVQHEKSLHPETERLKNLRKKEEDFGLHQLKTYLSYTQKVEKVKQEVIAFFQQVKKEGKTVAGYGAPAKGNTLLNFCHIRTNELPFTVDLSPHKQGCYLPGTHIPVHSPEMLSKVKPDYIFILPWNIKDEIIKQLEYTKEWGAKFVLPIPGLKILS